MTRYVLHQEVVQAELFDGYETVSADVTLDIPDRAVALNTVALTTSPMLVGITYLLPEDENDE